MKKIYLLIVTTFIVFLNLSITSAQDCTKLEKLSEEYIECNANLVKKKANTLKEKASKKVKDGKKKFDKSKFKEKLIIFKNSKNHKEFMEKIKNDN